MEQNSNSLEPRPYFTFNKTEEENRATMKRLSNAMKAELLETDSLLTIQNAKTDIEYSGLDPKTQIYFKNEIAKTSTTLAKHLRSIPEPTEADQSMAPGSDYNQYLILLEFARSPKLARFKEGLGPTPICKLIKEEVIQLFKLWEEQIIKDIENCPDYYDWNGDPEGLKRLDEAKEAYNILTREKRFEV